MKTKKKFDCVRMKDAIQANLREKWRGLTRAEIREEMTRSLADSDNSVAVWWRSLGAAKKRRKVTKAILPSTPRPSKTFDCIKMKRDIQAKLHKRWAGLTTEQIQDAIGKDLATSQTALAKWWRKMAKAQGKRSPLS